MNQKFYLDSCIWFDYFENRSDGLRPLGDWAFSLIKHVIRNNCQILYSDLVEEELNAKYSEKEIQEIFAFIPKENFTKVEASAEQLKEAIEFSRKLKIPVKDALHAILARDNDAIMVSRDKHFYELAEQVNIKKPEELI